MKIYRKVKLNIDTWDVVEEDSYEYDGPIAECSFGGGGGGGEVSYAQSPEQRRIFGHAADVVSALRNAAIGQREYAPLWDIPSPPVAQYDIPAAPMPTAQWMSQLDPGIYQALQQPYFDFANQALEQFGNIGTTRGGEFTLSGGGAQALEDVIAKAGRQIPLTAWQMGAPGRHAMWQAELAKRATGYDAARSLWQAQLQQEQFPFQVLPGLLGGTYSEPVVSQGGGPSPAGMLGGAGLGAGAAYGIGGASALGLGGAAAMAPYTMPLILGGGLLGSMF